MKIELHSDLHHEFFSKGKRSFEPTTGHEENVLVLAGDIDSNIPKLADFVRDCADAYKAVVFVPGNHEYYHNSVEHVKEQLQSLSIEIDNFHLLDDDKVMIDDTLFIGATMWTDFRNEDPMIISMAGSRMNDYNLITLAGVHLTPHDVLLMHRKSRDFVFSALEEAGKDQKTVVVTHHAPSYQLIHADYRHSGDINYCYYNDFDSKIEKYEPNLWLYGHTHASTYHEIGKTVICSNPYGYEGYGKNSLWCRDFLIDLESNNAYIVKGENL